MPRQSVVSQAVLTTRLKFLLLQSPFGILISPLGCFALSLALVAEVGLGRLVVWNLGMTLLAATRLALWYASPRKDETVPQARLWELILGSTMVAVALWWGLGALWVLPSSLEGRLLVFCGLLMMAGGSASLYSVHPFPTAASVIALIVPISTVFLVSEQTPLRVLGSGSWLFLLGSLRGIQMLNHFLIRSHELTHELERNVELLERSEKMREDLTLMLVHDLRSPLSGLIGRARLAREYGCDEEMEACSRELDRVEKISRSLVEMVNGILDVHRLKDGRMPLYRRETNSEELLGEALGSLGSDRERIEIQAEGSLLLACDKDLMRRVLVNLLSNALRYQPPSTPLRVCVSRPRAGWVEVRVVDRGPGIPEHDQEMIFDMYGQASRETRRGQTTGLGLTFCKLVVERHGGSIGVDSKLGKGSEFWFRLPCRHP